MNKRKIKILYLEDSESDVDQVNWILKKENLEFDCLVVEARDAYINALSQYSPDLVLSDHSLPAFNSLEALDILRKSDIGIPFIVVTGTVSEDFAVQVIMRGADDYILKDRPQRLPSAILKALEKYKEAREKKLADEKIRTSEANLAAIIENTGASVYSLDTNFRYIAFNGMLKNAMQEVFGITIKEGDKVFEFLEETNPAEARFWEKTYTEALSGKPVQFVKDYSQPGLANYLNFSINPIWKNGIVIGLSCLARDVTHWRIAADELRASEQRYRQLSQNPILGVAWISTEGKLLNANEAFCNMLGYTGLEIIDLHFSKYTYPEDAEEQSRIIEQLVWGKINTHRTEKRYLTKTGDLMWGELIFSAVKNDAGTVKYIICVVQNITDRKKIEAELVSLNESLEIKIKERTAALEEANRELEAFNYTVAHDLQSPIRTVSGFSKIILEDYGSKLDDNGKEQLHLINSMAKKMSQLIKDLLGFSKGGKRQVEKHEVDMLEVVKAIIEEIKVTEQNLAGEIKINALPSAWCDPALIKQVWSNLIQNAVKYSKNKEQRRIEIGSIEINGQISYYVKDNGIGFDMKNADKLFGVFHRLHKQEEFEGTGIGLATVHRIIHRHGGEIWADAKVNEGATFYFTLADK